MSGLTVNLVKISERASRPKGGVVCYRCKKTVAPQVHWFRTVTPDAAGRVHKVMVPVSDTTKGIKHGDTANLPVSAVHECDWKYVTPEGDTAPAPAPVTPAPAPAPVDAPAPAPAPAPVDAPAPVTPAPVVDAADSDMAAILTQLGKLLSRPAVDEDQVKAIVQEIVGGLVFPVKTVVVTPTETKTVDGLTHAKLSTLIGALKRRNVWMVGPAGTGKTTMAEQAAEALGLPFYSISCYTTMSPGELKGYMLPEGYVPSAFRMAFENGGVFNFDEIDSCHPSTLAIINAALSNGFMLFPDGVMVRKHADFRVTAAANTFGLGPESGYVGRQEIDAATLDRFAFVTVPVDEALETAVCHAQGASAATVDKVLDLVRRVRKNVVKNGLEIVVSPRASIGMCQLIADGFSFDEALDMSIKDKGIDAGTWAKLIAV